MARILIVEDESVVAWDLEESLERLGYTVMATVTSGDEAISISSTIKPDLILMDIMLEGDIDGIAAGQRIRDSFNIPVVYLTAHADDQTLQRALSTNPYGYIVKPFVERELYTTIEIALRRHQLDLKQDQTKQSLLTTLKNIGEATIATDANGYITFLNPVAESLIGWQKYEVLGKLASRILSLRDARNGKAIESPIEQALQKGTKITSENFGLLRVKNGEDISVNLTATPIRDREGKIIGSVIVCENSPNRQLIEAGKNLVETLARGIQQSFSIEDILNFAVTEIRQLFENNRAIIYRFNPDGSGSVIEESLTKNCQPMLGWQEYKPWIADPHAIAQYKLGQIQIIEDLYTRGLKSEHLQFIQFFDIRSQVVIPLFNREKLWGLLICYGSPVYWQWQEWQIEILKSLATQINIAIQQTEISEELKLTNQKLQEISGIDSLTGLLDRTSFDERLAREWKRLSSQEIPLAIILCDIDCFQEFNDTYGNEFGNDCLRKVASGISQSIARGTDLVARYAGEEFIVMLPHTNAEAAVWIAQKMRGTVKRLKIAHATSPVNRYVTLSFGVASAIPNLYSSPRMLVASADQALYQAKSQGRDRVILWNSYNCHVK
ncbi:MAG TPA: hypothetical protein DEG17_06280 [Cyanobacteria bacterium UBA11149]|nr:hypothetical protein [Cyanobacteria bacterium UBA11367]HBE59703.1 hypothetical protein [Cyanobacteria bacterium UBA11366]HBK63250.1 hypothetical protein [Cyanobacteria bacterium UBA11166]HBR76586.1 hypothetical protein [Cyanobacteria bacterium UBA11159]HBS69507.1 hypothetical protein [Cyanobacteria bacterium UBA11153]HBW88484.1 hypothetical protein [Cyanobacteria bacterium UBA11149]HCA94317.1 hypothetical protein [Cyanobacteria bacterium UBA9226]